jgi:hypothetical protein
VTEFETGIEKSARICEAKAQALRGKLGRNPMLDSVTQGIINILTDTAADIRSLTTIPARNTSQIGEG